ncbi:hypothetical protein AaE_001276, partial [Aphanomyces astaci]
APAAVPTTPATAASAASPAPPAPASASPFMDPAFVSQLLGGLPGVDPNDPKIKEAMEKLTKKQDESKDK